MIGHPGDDHDMGGDDFGRPANFPEFFLILPVFFLRARDSWGVATMRFKCPRCRQRVELATIPPGQPIVCIYCQARLKLNDHDTEVSLPVRARPPLPVLMAVPIDVEPIEVSRERVKDLRERRCGRREERGYRRKERLNNWIGAVGFAMVLTIVLLMLSGHLFRQQLPWFLGLGSCMGFPTALTGLVLSILGSARADRPKVFAIIGVLLGAMLILVLLPLAWVDLTRP